MMSHCSVLGALPRVLLSQSVFMGGSFAILAHRPGGRMDICVWHPSAAPRFPPEFCGAYPRHVAIRLGVLVPAVVLARRLLG